MSSISYNGPCIVYELHTNNELSNRDDKDDHVGDESQCLDRLPDRLRCRRRDRGDSTRNTMQSER